MKIGLISLGCPKNLVDSEVMLGLAQQAGHELTHDAADADVLVVNTCAFIDSAKQESIDTILEMAQHKKDGACRRLIVTGCLAERYRDELQTEIPEIDAVLGTGEVPEIVARDRRRRHRRRIAPAGVRIVEPSADSHADDALRPRTPHRAPSPSTLPTYIYDAETPRLLATPRHYAYVKIAEGCDYKCAFCIIPTLRGHYRSRPADSIVREARALAARGVKELLLISQDTTFYGIDRHERGALARLLRELNAVDGLEWIRLLYLYPTTIDDDTLAAMAECEKVCKYIDLPLQHASNAGAQAHEAARHAPDLRPAARAHPRARARRRAPHDVHRRLPGRDRGGRRRAVRLRQRPRVRPRRRLHLLARGRHVGLRARRRRAGRGQDARAANRVMGLQKRLVRSRQRGADRRARPRRSSTARRRTTSWCCKARLATQAPGHRRARST